MENTFMREVVELHDKYMEVRLGYNRRSTTSVHRLQHPQEWLQLDGVLTLWRPGCCSFTSRASSLYAVHLEAMAPLPCSSRSRIVHWVCNRQQTKPCVHQAAKCLSMRAEIVPKYLLYQNIFGFRVAEN